jgi:murein DD-endopeptidase MepM/ murein hydrolase activator NlpD
VRAFIVSVDGVAVGAVTEFEEIESFIKSVKSEYITDDVLSAEFDKEIEYGYEGYVSPEEIVSQSDIINKFNSIETEPEYYEVVAGDNPWDLSRRFDMSEEDFKQCFMTYNGRQITNMDKEFPIGAIIQLSAEVPYLQVRLTKESTFEEPVKYEVEYIDDPDMYKGESRTITEGVDGVQVVTALLEYKNDRLVGREDIESELILNPVNKVVRRGTRETKTAVSKGSGGGGSYFWPVGDGSGYISAYMGDRRGHKGIDIASPYGTPVYAAETGKITLAGWNAGYGNCIIISHDDGLTTLYGHMSKLADIGSGDRVVRGQLIGFVGSTGQSTGNHLHFEVKSRGKYLNPTEYVSK